MDAHLAGDEPHRFLPFHFSHVADVDMPNFKIFFRWRHFDNRFFDHSTGPALVLAELHHRELMLHAPLRPVPGLACLRPDLEVALPIDGFTPVFVGELLADLDKAGEEPAPVHRKLNGNFPGLLG